MACKYLEFYYYPNKGYWDYMHLRCSDPNYAPIVSCPIFESHTYIRGHKTVRQLREEVPSAVDIDKCFR